MADKVEWRKVWEQKAAEGLSDFELDRGRSPIDQETENLSERELLNFIEPKESETILDAGCGTGVNILRLHSRVRRIVGIDYARGSLERCRKSVQLQKIKNTHVCVASVTAIPLPGRSVNKVVCLSVLQYLGDEQARQALREFVRVLVPDGTIILHVKNLSSVYWSTLWLAKKVKVLLGGTTRIEYFRSFQWYANELAALECNVLGYDSFNLLLLDVMPQRLVATVRRFELRHHGSPFFRLSFVRRHGAELMVKARVACASTKASGTRKALG